MRTQCMACCYADAHCVTEPGTLFWMLAVRRPDRVAGAVARGSPLAYCVAFVSSSVKDVTLRHARLLEPRSRTSVQHKQQCPHSCAC